MQIAIEVIGDKPPNILKSAHLAGKSPNLNPNICQKIWFSSIEIGQREITQERFF